MSRAARATFRSTRWEETAVGEEDAVPRLTRATCEQVYEGDVAGTSALEYTMVYRDDGAASFVGLERIDGEILGKRGRFAIQHVGAFENGTARIRLTIVPGSGTGELRGVRGGGEFESAHAAEYEISLEVSFD